MRAQKNVRVRLVTRILKSTIAAGFKLDVTIAPMR